MFLFLYAFRFVFVLGWTSFIDWIAWLYGSCPESGYHSLITRRVSYVVGVPFYALLIDFREELIISTIVMIIK
jgi:hypothetical protein